MALPCLKNARRIFAIVSTTSIPTSASKNHGSQCGPSVPGSRLEADHPEKGVLFACRFTGKCPITTECLLFLRRKSSSWWLTGQGREFAVQAVNSRNEGALRRARSWAEHP